MAVKEIKMSEAIAEVAANFNENNNWARVYFNEDNGFIWWKTNLPAQKPTILLTTIIRTLWCCLKKGTQRSLAILVPSLATIL